MRVKDAVGRFGEDVAAHHLTDAGLTVLARNWRCREGELDIVADDHGVLVFVEVKTRSSDYFGIPAAAVGREKAARVRLLAVRWLAEHPQPSGPEIRFDVVAVMRGRDGVGVEHLRGAF